MSNVQESRNGSDLSESRENQAKEQNESTQKVPQTERNQSQEENKDGNNSDEAARIIQVSSTPTVAQTNLSNPLSNYSGTIEDIGVGEKQALKDAQYQNLTKAQPKVSDDDGGSEGGESAWKRLTGIAYRAAGDEDDPTEEEESKSKNQEYYHMKLKAKSGSDGGYSKTMGLEYWLEMVDTKHRYGANLSAFHKVWHDADTEENFFYWLDEGEGKNFDTEKCSRETLDKQQLRYLSREERQDYLLKIDYEGRFRWAKNGQRVTTNLKSEDEKAEPTRNDEMDGTSGEVESLDHKIDDLHNARGIIEASGSSVPQPLAWLVNTKFPKTTKSEWIFVMDTSFRVYAGRKESGVFQHSSFLHGSRVLSSGLIAIEDGLLRSVSPHSGHYRPTPENFWALIKCLEAEGVDMSGASVYQSYSILLAAQTYAQAASGVLSGVEALNHQKDKIFKPEEAAKIDQAQQDDGNSAQREEGKTSNESIVGQIKEVLAYPFSGK